MELIERFLPRIAKKPPGKAILLRALSPELINPNPCPIIHIHKILVIKMYRRYHILDQYQLLQRPMGQNRKTCNVYNTLTLLISQISAPIF